jgi:hypothetical protein
MDYMARSNPFNTECDCATPTSVESGPATGSYFRSVFDPWKVFQKSYSLRKVNLLVTECVISGCRIAFPHQYPIENAGRLPPVSGTCARQLP